MAIGVPGKKNKRAACKSGKRSNDLTDCNECGIIVFSGVVCDGDV